MSRLQSVGRLIWPLLWFCAIPPLLAGVMFRYLVPAPASEVASLRWLARLCAEHPLGFVLGLVLVFALILHGFREYLPGHRWFSDSSAIDLAGRQIPRSLWPVLALGGATAVSSVLFDRSLGTVYLVRDLSMLPTLNRFDQVLARAPSSNWRPARGELVVVRESNAKAEPERLGRVIGLPGDTISLRKGRPSINGWEVPACPAGRYLALVEGEKVDAFLLVEFLEDRAFLALGVPSAPSMDRFQVPAGQVFVLNDNRTRIRGARNGRLDGAHADPLRAIAGKVERIALRRRPDGQLDPASLLAPVALGVQIDGLDVADLQAKIGTCLAKRPADTRPPPRDAMRAALAGPGAP